jgi:hypothetical protein
VPVNEPYAKLHPLLLPDTWPPTPENQAAIAKWIDKHGATAYQAAVTSGQYQFDDGLFFGGKAQTWSNKTIRDVLRRHAGRARRVAWIDLHTGLGPNGLGERIFACRDDKVAYARANAWWGTPAAPVTSIYDGSSTSALLRGLMWDAMYEECPQAEYTGIALEYGTLPMLEVTGALRADHWLHKHPEAPADLADGSVRGWSRPSTRTPTRGAGRSSARLGRRCSRLWTGSAAEPLHCLRLRSFRAALTPTACSAPRMSPASLLLYFAAQSTPST